MKTNLYLENTVSSQTDILDVVKEIEEIILLQAYNGLKKLDKEISNVVS